MSRRFHASLQDCMHEKLVACLFCSLKGASNNTGHETTSHAACLAFLPHTVVCSLLPSKTRSCSQGMPCPSACSHQSDVNSTIQWSLFDLSAGHRHCTAGTAPLQGQPLVWYQGADYYQHDSSHQVKLASMLLLCNG